MNLATIMLNGLANLVDINPEFKGEKIEGICVEWSKEAELLLHLISDNDCGDSKLFKLRMLLK
jgi:hypothetical protein